MVCIEEKIEALRELLEEIHESTFVYLDMKQPEETLREALQEIWELTDVYADMSAA